MNYITKPMKKVTEYLNIYNMLDFINLKRN